MTLNKKTLSTMTLGKKTFGPIMLSGVTSSRVTLTKDTQKNSIQQSYALPNEAHQYGIM